MIVAFLKYSESIVRPALQIVILSHKLAHLTAI